jgi:hypothetical protein
VLHSINRIVRSKIYQLIYEDLISNDAKPKPQIVSFRNQVRKIIAKDAKFELLTVLSDSQYREYFVYYLQTFRSPSTLVSLGCWIEIRRLLDYPSTDSQGLNLSFYDTISFKGSPPKPSTSAPSPPRPMKHLSSTATNTSTNPNANLSFSSMASSSLDVSDDVYLQFRRLLQALRDLCKKYKLHTQQSSNAEPVTSISMRKTSRATSSDIMLNEAENQMVLSISDSIRLEIITLVSSMQSIRMGDIESLDEDYIASSTQKILKVFRVLERETFQQLQYEYADFVERLVRYVDGLAHELRP